MKKTRIFFAMVAGAAAIACSKEAELPETGTAQEEPAVVEPSERPSGVGIFKASISEDASKVTLTDGYQLEWVAEDKVAVYKSGVAAYSVYTASSSGVSTDLTGAALDTDATYYAVYPERAAVSFEGGLNVKIAPEQALTADGIADNVIVAKTTGAEASFSFRNLGSLVQFTLDAAKNVEKVVLSAIGGEDVAGTVNVDLSGAAPSYTVGSGSKSITLTPSDGGTFASGTYYAAILPGTYSAGLCVKLFDKDGKEVVLEQNGAQTITRSRRLPLGAIDGVKAFTMNHTISDAAEFVNFLSHADAEVWTVSADIDLSGVSLPSVADFAGTLDGGSHTVNNLSLTAPLFTTLSGTVKDLTIGSGSRFTVPGETGSYAFIAGTNSGTITGVNTYGSINASTEITPASASPAPVYIAAIAGVSSGSITSSANHANITVDAKNIGMHVSGDGIFVAGVVGDLVGAGKLGSAEDEDDIVNNGKISFSPNGSSTTNYVGGVCARRKSGVTATLGRCTNKGDVVFSVTGKGSASWVAKVGGVIGFSYADLSYCKNTGKVDFDVKTDLSVSDALRNTVVGGVAGAAYGNIANCTNSGAVDVCGTFGSPSSGTTDAVYVAGVAAFSNVDNKTYSECRNEAPITVKSYFNDADAKNTITGHFGGVFGCVAASSISNCSNTGALDITSTQSVSYVGGIAGFSKGSFTASDNGNTITFDMVRTAETYKQSKNCFVGGVVGKHEAAYSYSNSSDVLKNITRCNNTGSAITIKNGYYSSDISYIGGIAGWVQGRITGEKTTTRVTNKADIAIDGNIQARVGGITGNSNFLLGYCENDGNITFPNMGKASIVGGFVGVRGRTATGVDDKYYNNNQNASIINCTINCNYSGNQSDNQRVGLCYGQVTGAMTLHSSTIEAASQLVTTNCYAGIAAGRISNIKLTLGNGSNKFTVKQGVSVNDTKVTTGMFSDTTNDGLLVGANGTTTYLIKTNVAVE